MEYVMVTAVEKTDETTIVVCTKCSDEIVTPIPFELGGKSPVCKSCWNLIEGMRVAGESGFHFGL